MRVLLLFVKVDVGHCWWVVIAMLSSAWMIGLLVGDVVVSWVGQKAIL